MIAAAEATAEVAPAPSGGRRKLVLLALPLLLAGLGAGLWFSGLLPRLLGMHHGAKAAEKTAERSASPVYIELPEIIANLDAGRRRDSYVKIKARIELARPEDQTAVTAAMPRLQDLFQTYLRDMHPDELRGSAGTYRLREELIARANVAAGQGRVVDVLFTELLVQ